MNEELLKKELVHISHKVYKRGLTQATGGNISVRVPGRDAILIKRSGISLGEVTKEDALLLSREGDILEGYGTPSKEYRFHLGIYRTRPDVQAVVHCHPNYAIGYACLGIELPLPTVTAQKILGHVPVTEAAPSGSQELAYYVTEVFEKYPNIKAALMKDHGICAVGPSLEAAYNIATLVEDTAKQAFIKMQIQRALSQMNKREAIQ
ncbi:class II aldolase/adducin family protein [Neobacillus ginsengisoli]|uniref:L-fuculose-phosphate aldolase n=1 Tax=Neobacillus ginsengisoli TaxID=904295 RepID=A0ABT9XWK5_9BACI|nr:class II aldolase/adducin family protein [Neobacillus ginsengisoli]MDQ0199711.1 L-fuculose-phosphate aldolase [Neobacillus ginsengisoli]